MERYNHLAHEMGQSHLAQGGLLRLTVSGRSMAPSLLPGDTIWVEGITAVELQPGDLVLARREGDMVTHRFLFADRSGWHLKGDACSLPDTAFPAEAIIGRAVLVERDGRKIDLKTPEMVAASRKLLWVSKIESGFFSTIKGFTARILPHKMRSWAKPVVRWTSSPFRWIHRLLYAQLFKESNRQ
jgi:hypothetical protein